MFIKKQTKNEYLHAFIGKTAFYKQSIRKCLIQKATRGTAAHLITAALMTSTSKATSGKSMLEILEGLIRSKVAKMCHPEECCV